MSWERLKIRSLWFAVALIVLGFCAMQAGIVFGAEEEVQEKKVTLTLAELPAEIRKAVNKALPKGKIVTIEKEVQGEDPGQYDLEVKSGGKLYEVEVSPEGEVLEVKELSSEEELVIEKLGKKWTDSFNIEDCHFSTRGQNRYFILEPGFQLVLASKTEKVIITVLNETKRIGDVETRIIEEREWEDGELKEVSKNFFAICKEHGDVFYFGEEVDEYEDGKVVKHSGAWRADQKNSKAGIIMPGTILLGARHYQEIAPNAMDRAEIIGDDVTMKTPAGKFENCIKVEETSGVEPGEKCYKIYAPGIGLVQDEDLLLVKYSKAGKGESEDEDEGEKVSINDVPKAVSGVVRKQASGGKVEDIERIKKEGQVIYEVDVMIEGQEIELQISPEGKLLSRKVENDKEYADKENGKKEEGEDEDEDDGEKVSINDVPKAVISVIRKQASGGKVEDIERIKKEGQIIYEVDVMIKGQEVELQISPEGKLLSRKVENDKEDADNDDEKKVKDEEEDEDEKVSIDDVPEPVKKRILKLVKNGEIEEIERIEEKGKVIYEVDIKRGGRDIEFQIGAKGKVLNKKVEEEDDDDDKDDKDND